MEFNVKRMGMVLAAALLVLFGTLNAALAWTLSGTVYGGSNPLPGATVTLTNAGTSAQVGSVSTDTGGKFSFNADNGTYNLAIAPPAGSGFTSSTVNNVSISGADATQSIVLIQQAVILSGAVRTPAGVGMKNIKVLVIEQSSSVAVGEQYTDANGNYSLPVGSGIYRFEIAGGTDVYGYCGPNGEYQQCPSNVPVPGSFYGYSIVQNLSVSGNTTQNITVPLVSLTGKTVDGNGVAVANVPVRQTYRSINQSVGYYSVENYSSVTSDASGNYKMMLISGSGYNLTLLPPAGSSYTQTSLTDISVTTDTVRNLAFQQAYTLSGTVRTPAGVGVQNLEVAITDPAGYVVTSKFTDASGNYSISLSNGSYSVNIYGGSRYSGNCGADRSYQLCVPNVPVPQTMYGYGIVQGLAVAGNTTQNITLPLVTLSGKTTDSNGIPVAGVTLEHPYNYAYQTTGYYFVSGEQGGGPISDAAGNYSLPLISGTGYSVKLRPATGGPSTIITGIDVRSDTVRDLALQPTATLSGRVRTPGGTGIKNIRVIVTPQASDSSVGDVYTDASGAFAIPVTHGTYKFTVIGGADSGGYCGAGGAYGQCPPSVTTPQYFEGGRILQNVVVTGDTVQDVLLPLVLVSGKTTDSNGHPVPNVTVKQTYNYVYPGTGYYYVSNESINYPIKSDAYGNYSFALMAGTGYHETITPPAGSGFAPTVLNGVDATGDFSQTIILNLPDTTAPQILSGPTVSSFTDTTATVEWQTNEPSKGSAVYGTVDPPGTGQAEQAFVSSHSMQLTALSPNTKYYVKVTASDAAGNGPTASQAISFTTAPRPDTTPPTVTTGPTVSSITQGSAVIEWTTDEPTTGTVVYGLSTLPDKSVDETTLAGSHRATLSGLAADTIYYVKVTAIDAAKNGPVSTTVVSFRTLAAPDTTPPVVVEGPMAISISDTGATIVWKTDEPATSGVSYDDGVAYGVLSDGALTTSHSMTITGLAASKNYNFTVSSKDASGNGPTLSLTKSFSSKEAPDTNPPVFDQQLPIVKETTHQSALLYWETDEPASSTIQYGITEALELTDAKSELNTKHNRALTGLLPGTTYYFRVQATDAQKNSATSKIYSFTTDLNPDTKAPIITEAASIVYSTDNAATVAFATDKPCDTVVKYGPDGTTVFQMSNSEKVNEHQMTVTNLSPNTSYNVEVSCTDISGNKVVTSAGTPSTLLAMNYSFMLSDAFVGAAGGVGLVTKSQPDKTAPVITNAPRATANTSTMVRIQWVTDEIADSQVFFGLTGQSLTSSAGDIVKSAGHSVALTNLKPGTTYDFKVQSTDPSNNTVLSAVYSFTTAAVADTTAPVISAISAGATSSRMDVSWNTDEQATTVLKYGTSPFALTGQASVTGSRTSHAVSLYNLVAGTTYYVAPVSTDGSGNSVQGATQSVTLAGLAPASYTVTASAGLGGSITPVSQSVFTGYQLALAVKPNTGYVIQSVAGCGGTLSGSVYTTAEITGNCTVSALFKSDGTLPAELTTTATPAGGSYSGGILMVKLSANSNDAVIYYTTDGTTPSVSSAAYSAPVVVNGNMTLKFFAKDSTRTEPVRNAVYTVSATGQPAATYAGIKPGTTFTVSRSEAGRTATTVYAGSQTSFVETGSLKPNTIYTYTVSSDVEGNSELFSIRTPLSTGWNIVAVPYDTTGVATSTLFSSPVSAVYQWVPTGATSESSNTVLGSYKTVTSLLPGYGYFVKSGTPSTTINYKGAGSSASATVTLKPGWTMIANQTGDNMSHIASNWGIDGNSLGAAILSNKIGGGIYWWNGTTYESWSIVNDNPIIEPWKGYWILNLDSVNHTLSLYAK